LRRIRNTQSWSYDSLMLFREDLEELLRIFNPTGAADAITILDDECEYSSLEEVGQEKGDRLDHLIIRSRKPGIMLELRRKPKLLNLFTLETTDEADAAYFRANEFLQPKRRPLNSYVTFGLRLLLIIAIFLELMLWTARPTFLSMHFLVLSIAILLLCTMSLPLLDQATFYLVSLARKHQSPSFWTRKRDDLIMLFLGTLLGIGATILVGRLIRHP